MSITVKIDFGDGLVRGFTLIDAVEIALLKGEEIAMYIIHPKYGDTFEVGYGTNIRRGR